MDKTHPDRFVRLPTALLESLLPVRLSGIQWRILLWVIRQTYGWGRRTTPFSWYGIAHQIQSSRSHAFSEGRRLLEAQILVANGAEIGVRGDSALWNRTSPVIGTCGFPNVRDSERFSFGNPDITVRKTGLFRSENRTLSRRAKERCKERERKKEMRTGANDGERHNSDEVKPVLPAVELAAPVPENGAVKTDSCKACQQNLPWEWHPPVIVACRPLAGTGVWRSPTLDDLCPACFSETLISGRVK